MLKTLRRFIFKPSQSLEFKEGKCLLMQAHPDQSWYYNLITGGSLGTTGLLASNLLLGPLGIYKLAFTGVAFAGSLVFGKVWNEYSKKIVKQIFLLEDGKNIEIVHFGLLENKIQLAIKELKDPETSESVQTKMKMFGVWVIETKDQFFLVQPNNQTFHPDVLKAVFKVQEIDTSSRNDYLDIK